MSQTSVQADKKTRFPIAGGILILIAAGLSLFVAIVGSILLENNSLTSDAFNYVFQWMIVTTSAFFAFIFGLPSSIFSIKRIHFGFSIFGIGIVLASASLTIIYLGGWLATFLCGLPILLLSLTSLVFVSISKREFS